MPNVAVPNAPLVIPVKSLELIPEYVIISFATATVPPPVGKPVVDVNVTAVSYTHLTLPTTPYV